MISRMMQNRSVPCDAVLPHVLYRNLPEALSWLTKAFGFKECYRYGDPLSGAQVYLGKAYIMVSHVREDAATPNELGYGTQLLTIFIDDIEAHYEAAKRGGARIIEEPHETCYGEWQYAALDCEGHKWLFSRHARDVSPEQWGATMAQH